MVPDVLNPARYSCEVPPGRNRPVASTLRYKVSGLCASPPGLKPRARRKEVELIENCQNKADFLGVYRCHTSTYDKESRVSRGP